MLVTNQSGTQIEFDDAVDFMDDHLRERLHDKLAPCSDQRFFTAYEDAHRHYFEEDWELSKSNPTW
jgi:hypothetical protein